VCSAAARWSCRGWIRRCCTCRDSPYRVITPEDNESALSISGLIDGRAGEAQVCGVGQGCHQVVAQVSTGGAVGFIHQDKDIGSGIEVGRDIIELVDHADDQAAAVAGAASGRCRFDLATSTCAETYRGQVAEKLRFQLVAVHQHQHGGVFKNGLFQDALGGGDHGVGLARALRVPDQAALFFCGCARTTRSTARIWWGAG
jgi:hypothetical protein